MTTRGHVNTFLHCYSIRGILLFSIIAYCNTEGITRYRFIEVYQWFCTENRSQRQMVAVYTFILYEVLIVGNTSRIKMGMVRYSRMCCYRALHSKI